MQFSRHPSTSSSSSSSSLSSSSFPNNVRNNPNRTYIPNHIHVPSAPLQEQFYAAPPPPGQNHFYHPQEVAPPLRNGGAAYHHHHHHSRTMPRHPPSYNNRFHYPSPIEPNGVVYGGGAVVATEHVVGAGADHNHQHYARISQSSQYLPQIHHQDAPHPHPLPHQSPVLRDLLPDNPVLKFHGSVGKEIDV